MNAPVTVSKLVSMAKFRLKNKIRFCVHYRNFDGEVYLNKAVEVDPDFNKLTINSRKILS